MTMTKAAVAVALLLGASALTVPTARAQGDDVATDEFGELPAGVGQPVPLEDEVGRLEALETRLEAITEKIDRLDSLLRMIFAERIRRIETIAADEELARAIPLVERRYGLRGMAGALTDDGIERLVELRKALARASAAAGRAEFAADPDVATVLAAMAARREFLDGHGRRLLVGLAGDDTEALGTLVAALIARPSAAAREVALWAALRARGEGLAENLSTLARETSPAEPRIHALAQAAAASHGDEEAAGRLVAFVEGSADGGAFAHRLAGELAAAGSKTAFRVYLVLVREEKYAFAAAQAFGRIEGFDRRVGWREVRERRTELHDELKAWLERNYDSIRYEEKRRRFVLAP